MIIFLHPTVEDRVWASLENGSVKIHMCHNEDTIVMVLDSDAAASLVIDLFDCLSSLLNLSKLSTGEKEYAPF